MSNGRAVQMASRRVQVDNLAPEVEKILKKYGEDVTQNLGLIVKEMTKKGAKTLQGESGSTFGGTGKYAGGWSSVFEDGRVSKQGTIYNKDVPGLPHLLEHGHANRGGGRTPGRIHISRVEQALIKEFEEKVKSKL